MTTTTDARLAADTATALHTALSASHVRIAELAAALGVPAASLNEWRYGRRTMPAAMRARIAVLLLRRAEDMRHAAEAFADLVPAPASWAAVDPPV